jgi:hypothetical protein
MILCRLRFQRWLVGIVRKPSNKRGCVLHVLA